MLRDLKSLERDLEAARATLAALQARGVDPGACSHDWLDGMARLTDSVRTAERSVCAARGDEYAAVWQDGLTLRRNSLPRVFQKGTGVTVVAVVQHVSPDWKGRVLGNLSYTEDSPIARIQYQDAQARRLVSAPVESHPLFGRGLDPHRILEIIHPAEENPLEHHLMMFDGAWIEIRGVPIAAEVWPDRLEDVARHCGGIAL